MLIPRQWALVALVPFCALASAPVAIASFDGSPASGPAPLLENLDGTSSYATTSGAWIASYQWNFGDGSPVSNAGWVQHTYTAGRYIATLTVTDSNGATSQATLRIQAQGAGTPDAGAPDGGTRDAGTTDAGGGSSSTAIAVARFDGSPSSGPAPLTEYLDGTTSYCTTPGGWISTFHWDFGDGSTSTDGWTTHVYSRAGVYRVVLSVTDSNGQAGTATLQVTATGAGFDAGAVDAGSPDAGAPDAGVEAGTPDAGAADAGRPDAGTPDAGTPDAGVADAGSPDAGDPLAPVARANFDGSPAQGAVPLAENLDGTSSYARDPAGWIATYQWDFQDGTSSNQGWVQHTFTRTGTYAVRLTVTDNAGRTASTTINVYAGTSPDAGVVDAGVPDAGSPDAGTPDAGRPDAGTSPDAGSTGGLNPVARENQLPGDTGWQLHWYTSSDDLSGWLSTDSALAGDTVTAYVQSRIATSIRYAVYRMGWYGGAGGRQVFSDTFQGFAQPKCSTDSSTGLVDCSNWAPSFSFTVPSSWVSGVYLIKMTRSDGPEAWLIFTLRDQRQADVMVQQAVATWQAYNNYGGESLYEDVLGLPNGHASKVSYNRPYVSPSPGEGEFLEYEANFVQWIEAQGYDATYVTNLDFSRDPSTAQRAKVFLSLGHDEYWAADERNALETARDRGVSQGYFSANTAYWQIRLESGPNGPLRVQTCYKDATIDPLGSSSSATVQWRQAPVNRPENALLGVMFDAWQPVNGALAVRQPSHWLFSGTGLGAADSIGLVIGYESDHTWSNGLTPPGTQVLASLPVMNVYGVPAMHELSLYTASSGALVLGSGTIEWGWGLSAPGFADARLQTITANFLAHTGAAATTPMVMPGSQNAWSRSNFTGASSSVTTLAGIADQHGDQDGSVTRATLNQPSGIAVGADGTLYFSDANSHRIRQLKNGVVSTLAGGTPGAADGTGTSAQFLNPHGIALGSDGALYVADSGNNCIRRVTASGIVSTWAGTCASWNAGLVNGATNSAKFRTPQGIAISSSGVIYIADSGNNAIRKISGGSVSTVAASPGGQYDRSVFFFPNGITVGDDGYLYVVDGGHRAVLRVSTSGSVTTLISKAPNGTPYPVPDGAGGGFVDGAASSALAMPGHGIVKLGGAVFFSDSGNNRVRRIDLSSMNVTTFAGTGRATCEDGDGTSASTEWPMGLTAANGALYLSDSCGAIRRIGVP